jgi:arylsulfatase A-like enzyme
MRIDYPTVPSPLTEQGITRDDNTDGRLLHAAGYDTHHYGKWHLHGDTLPYYVDTFGEHIEYQREMAGVFEQVRKGPRATWMDWYGWALPVAVSPAFQEAVHRSAGKWNHFPHTEFVTKAGRLELPLQQIFDIRVTDHAVRRLQTSGSQPFMITASLNHPHDPNVIPSPYYEQFQPANIRLPSNSLYCEKCFEADESRRIANNIGEVGVRELLRIYYASVRLVDDQVGHLLDSLEKTGRAQDTIVVFTTDHGDMAGGHGMVWKSTSAFYDEIVRVPLLISYPRAVKSRTSDLPVSSVDIMPTLLDLVGQRHPAEVQGRSIAPYLLDENNTAGARRYTFCERVKANPEHTRHVSRGTHGSFMVRGEGWKYIRYPDGGEYLYQLSKDPGETKNLAGDPYYCGEKDALKREMHEWLSETGYPEA